MAKLVIRFSPALQKKAPGERQAVVDAAMAWGRNNGARVVRESIASQHPFKNRTGAAAHLWTASANNGEIRISSLVPYTRWLNYGWRGGPMWWLEGKTIPLYGGLIFRRVTRKALEQGKWARPARSPSFFFERAMEALIEDLQERFPELEITLG